ncbi:MAG: discoidin domain-containing protein [Candidatus Eremiobacteraeota bacterium]|nr:discoidin domain-containing protein [Candidatus Eremiobacteraeota bacterium]
MHLLLVLIAAISSSTITVHVDTAPAQRLNVIRPLHAIGVGIDSDPAGKIPFLYSPRRTRAMLGAGLGTVSARLYTELSIQDWHWNPAGTFSDAQHNRGYWTSSSSLANPPIVDSFGYALPHRGSTRDQGDDDDYSRIDDGDAHTYWKSNPYLTQPYTHEPDSEHPQWAVIDFIHPKPVNAIRISWLNPYATRYDVQYWTGGDAIIAQASGTWHTFPAGVIKAGTGGNAFIRLARAPLTTRFVRILMTASSDTCDSYGSADRRNCLGYAIQDVALGPADANGTLQDLIRYDKCGGNPERPSDCGQRQTIIMVSSIDPWHAASDRIRNGQDQPGLDMMSRNVITRGLPMMYAVPLFYSTPANAAAMVRYLHARGYKLNNIEMGEEVDGQYAMPEDYASLYIQFAQAIHAVYPQAKLGGPAFQGVNADIKVWADAHGDDSWFRRFLNYLRSHGHLNDLAFMSYEHYPFRGCDQGVTLRMDLLREPAVLRGTMDAWWADGLPKSVPTYISEVNFANNGGPVPKQIEGALWMADWIGTALSHGLSGLNHYQYETEPMGHSRQCNKWGGYTMFIIDQHYHILAKAAQYYAAQMLTQHWLQPGDEEHEIYPVTMPQAPKNPAVTGYSARRPDGMWSMMLINKDSEKRRVLILFDSKDGSQGTFGNDAILSTFGSTQYHWNGNSAAEIPSPNHSPVVTTLRGQSWPFVDLPPLSITVITGNLKPAPRSY